MKDKILNMIKSPVVTLSLLVIYVLCLSLATLVEKYHGAAVSQANIYHAWWFICLQVIMVINAIGVMLRRALFSGKSFGSLLLHLSFIVILIGAFTTHIWGREGYIQLRETESTNYYIDTSSKELIELDFSIRLDDFVLTRYAGSASPSSYQSHITIQKDGVRREAIVATNQVVNMEGYRLFQTSFDRDEMGTLLTVNYDVPGMQITYLGYFLLLLGIIALLFQPRSRMRSLIKRLKALGAVSIAIFAMMMPTSLNAQNSVDPHQAELFGALLIQNNKGRVEPVNTWSSKIVRKIHNAESYKGFTSDQILLNIMLLPHQWAEEPIIRIKNKEIRAMLDCGEYTHYNSLFDSEGDYRLAAALEHAYDTPPAERNKLQKDIITLDEVVNIFYQIQDGAMLPLFPHPYDSKAQWLNPNDKLEGIVGQDSLFLSKIIPWYAEELLEGLSTGDYSAAERVVGMINTYQHAKSDESIDLSHIKAELRYNRLNIFGRIIRFYFIFGALLLLIQLIGLFRGEAKWVKILSWICLASILIIFLFHCFGITLRWYIAGHGPWSNSYETMVFVAWSTICMGLIFAKKSPLVTALCSLLAGILLFVSSLNWMNPEISPLVPVLQSYWLMLHVAMIMLSYGLLFINWLLGATNLVTMSLLRGSNQERLLPFVERMTIIGELAMIVGVCLLAVGIFLGAVWANVSWGRYWGWDPKETWALITLMVYVGVLHMRFVPRLNNNWLFNVKSTWAILSVLMTYFGVNYLLSGMHSYGNINGEINFLPFAIALAVLIILTTTSRIGCKRAQI